MGKLIIYIHIYCKKNLIDYIVNTHLTEYTWQAFYK